MEKSTKKPKTAEGISTTESEDLELMSINSGEIVSRIPNWIEIIPV